ncbi:MAG TPA: hypothetical protein VHW01_20765 [Polyangiaceae bacterium]|jgi:hypothetical protein|nr:hypothetical protein [Polyangiaceae bacterium]
MSTFGTLGCSSSDKNGASDCGSAANPMVFEVKDVSPAIGASVPNSNIVQTFTIVGQHLEFGPDFALPALHTAGTSTPNPITWSLAVSGADTVFTSMPISWATAPGHVELDPGSPVEDTTTSCVWTLPTPTFSYDVTAP